MKKEKREKCNGERERGKEQWKKKKATNSSRREYIPWRKKGKKLKKTESMSEEKKLRETWLK